MLFPIRTDRRMRHTPWVNYALLAANVVIFALTMQQVSGIAMMGMASDEQIARRFPVFAYYLFNPQSPMHHWYQYFTSQFLHANVEHLVGNMIFLYVFGNALEDRLGPIGYLAFYLAGGVIAGVGHVMTSMAPVLGASGAISAVTGAYLALFPLVNVTIVYWFFFIGMFEISSMWLILFSFCRDVYSALAGGGGVAYLAHISGNVFGFAIGMGLLWIRLLPREPYDFLAMADRWNRRRKFRAATRQGAAPWQSQAGDVMAGKARGKKQQAQDHRSEKEAEHRQVVREFLTVHDQVRALDAYEKLAGEFPQAVLSRQNQLDLANYAMAEQRYELAAHAYEGFLRAFSYDEYRTQVQMILGLIYARYVRQPDRAAELLNAAIEKLDDAGQIQVARDTLSQLGKD